MSTIPKVGDTISVKCDRFTGAATVTYIDAPALFNHYQLPIQCEIAEKDLHQFEENNHGQRMVRFSLLDIASSVEAPPSKEEPIITENIQGSLFDDF